MKNFGFTLAEVIITLGIIGVVSAMTIPALQQRIYERQTISRLKTTYSILKQALKLTAELDDNGNPEGWGITGRTAKDSTLVAEKMKPYLKISNDCGTVFPNSCIGKTYYRLNGTNISFSHYYSITLMNGATVMFNGGDNTTDKIYAYFYVDTNGPALPNTWGKDVFEFTYSSELGLVPSGHPNLSTNDYRKFCTNRLSTGYGCAYYVLTFGNMDYLH